MSRAPRRGISTIQPRFASSAAAAYSPASPFCWVLSRSMMPLNYGARAQPRSSRYGLLMGHQSDSLEQRTAEPLILAGVSKMIGVELAPRSLRLRGGAPADVDGAA